MMKRPMTANIKPSKGFNSVPSKKKQNKKTDPVSRYQNLQNEWKSNRFLNKSSLKEGRKLDIDRYHKWSSQMLAYH